MHRIIHPLVLLILHRVQIEYQNQEIELEAEGRYVYISLSGFRYTFRKRGKRWLFEGKYLKDNTNELLNALRHMCYASAFRSSYESNQASIQTNKETNLHEASI